MFHAGDRLGELRDVAFWFGTVLSALLAVLPSALSLVVGLGDDTVDMDRRNFSLYHTM